MVGQPRSQGLSSPHPRGRAGMRLGGVLPYVSSVYICRGFLSHFSVKYVNFIDFEKFGLK